MKNMYNILSGIYIPDKDLAPRIYKDLIYINKKANNLNKTGQKT